MFRGPQKTVVIIAIIIGAIFAMYAGFIRYQKNRDRQKIVQEIRARDQIRELHLLIKDRDCASVVKKASEYARVYPRDERFWHLKGMCEFSLGEIPRAKYSFEKVLALDPNHEAAKNYLQRIASRPGEVVVAPTEILVGGYELEARVGLKLGELFRLEKAVRRPSNIPEYLEATYTSASSYSKTIARLKSELEKSKVSYSASETTEGTAILVFNLPKEQTFFTVFKGSLPVKIEIKYLKHE